MGAVRSDYFSELEVESVDVEAWRVLFDAIGYPDGLDREALTSEKVGEVLPTLETPTAALLEALEVLHMLGTDDGRTAVHEAMQSSRIDTSAWPQDATPAQIAIRLFVASRGNATIERVLRAATLQGAETAKRRIFREFAGARPGSLRASDGRVEAFRERLVSLFTAAHLGTHVQVRVMTIEDTYNVHVIRGAHFRSRVEIRGAMRQRHAFRPAQEDLLQYDGVTGRLKIGTSLPSLVLKYREIFGATFFDEPPFFAGDDMYSLKPIQERGASALRNHNVYDLYEVRLKECLWDRGDGQQLWLRGDCFRQIGELQLPIDQGELIEAKLHLRFSGPSTRPVLVTVKVPNRVEVSKSRHEPVVDRFLEDVGIRTPTPATRRTDLWEVGAVARPEGFWREALGSQVDVLVRQRVLVTCQLERVEHPDFPGDPAALRVERAGEEFYGVSEDSSVPPRLLTPSDVAGLQLDVDRWAHELARALELTGPIEVLQPGLIALGERALGSSTCVLFLVSTPPGDNTVRIARRAREVAGPSSRIALLVPRGRKLECETPQVGFALALAPKELLRGLVRALRLEAELEAKLYAPEGAVLVVDPDRRLLWFGDVQVGKLGPQEFAFAELVARRNGGFVSKDELLSAMGSPHGDDTVTKQGKHRVVKAIKQAFANCGVPEPDSLKGLFASDRNRGYRATVSCYVPTRQG